MKNEELKIGVKLIGIDILSKTMAERPVNFQLTSPYNFNIRVQTKVIAERNIVMSIVDVTVNELNNPVQLAAIKTACLFEIENFNTTIKKNDNNLFDIPKELDVLLRPIALSTTRGIIYSEFRGTYLASAVMPIIFIDAMKEDIPANKETE